MHAEAGVQAEAQAEAQALLPPSMYTWWPTSAPLAHEELGRLLLAPLYAALADAPLFLALPREGAEGSSPPRRVLRRLEEGLVCHGAVAPRVGEFVRAHFTLFDLPPPVAEEVTLTLTLTLRWRRMCSGGSPRVRVKVS